MHIHTCICENIASSHESLLPMCLSPPVPIDRMRFFWSISHIPFHFLCCTSEFAQRGATVTLVLHSCGYELLALYAILTVLWECTISTGTSSDGRLLCKLCWGELDFWWGPCRYRVCQPGTRIWLISMCPGAKCAKKVCDVTLSWGQKRMPKHLSWHAWPLIRSDWEAWSACSCSYSPGKSGAINARDLRASQVYPKQNE